MQNEQVQTENAELQTENAELRAENVELRTEAELRVQELEERLVIAERTIVGKIYSKHRAVKCETNANSECSICLQEAADCQLTCGHRYHELCIARWYYEGPFVFACPYCRQRQ